MNTKSNFFGTSELIFFLLLFTLMSLDASDVYALMDKIELGTQAFQKANYEEAVRYLSEPSIEKYELYKNNPTSENQESAYLINCLLGAAYDKLTKPEEALFPYKRALSVLESSNISADRKIASLQGKIVSNLLASERLYEAANLLRRMNASLPDVYGTKSDELYIMKQLFLEVSYRVLNYEDAQKIGKELVQHYSEDRTKNESEVARITKILNRIEYYFDEVEVLKKNTGYVYNVTGMPKDLIHAWIAKHPVGAHDFSQIFGDKSQGIMYELNKMKLPHYVLESNPTVRVGVSSEISRGQVLNSLPKHLTIGFDIIVSDDAYKNMKWDMQMGEKADEIIEDYSQVLGWAVGDVFNNFPEAVYNNQIVIELEFEIQSDSMHKSGAQEKIRLNNPVRIKYVSIEKLKEQRQGEFEEYEKIKKEVGQKRNINSKNETADAISPLNRGKNDIENERDLNSYYEELGIKK